MLNTFLTWGKKIFYSVGSLWPLRHSLLFQIHRMLPKMPAQRDLLVIRGLFGSILLIGVSGRLPFFRFLTDFWDISSFPPLFRTFLPFCHLSNTPFVLLISCELQKEVSWLLIAKDKLFSWFPCFVPVAANLILPHVRHCIKPDTKFQSETEVFQTNGPHHAKRSRKAFIVIIPKE